MKVNFKSLIIVPMVALTLGASSGLSGLLTNHQPRVHASSFKASNYPMIQDNLQSMNNDQLFMTSSVVRGTVESWGATKMGTAQIILQDPAGNKFLLCPNSNKGLKHIAVGKTITAYGSGFVKQKVNDTEMNVGIDPQYYGEPIINVIGIDKISIDS